MSCHRRWPRRYGSGLAAALAAILLASDAAILVTRQIPWLRVFVEGVVIGGNLRPDIQSPSPIR